MPDTTSTGDIAAGERLAEFVAEPRAPAHDRLDAALRDDARACRPDTHPRG
ncbi:MULTISPECIES: hypothetical protein [unclassified Modicisalibacter]|uniref:hypothetical protein n=1 Tax=unclassified Modicisalibacter TaxID=2679913 RepID=UPI001CCCB6DF|nr:MULTISPECIES: hypothetical protein [unclassified Modicisalibacter]MBZ9559370.1 hypothetical protein [Modicisalibacter sp. R2A 31.J]MBZ9576465.1 hypothetical protein [Modicisalibacter sp. MOD 31.J]